MIFCDWQQFWHRHYQRPPLPRGFMTGGGMREVMKDDGSIVEEYQPSCIEIWKSSGAEAKLREFMNEPSPLWEALTEKKDD